jgi:hypothetical protein
VLSQVLRQTQALKESLSSSDSRVTALQAEVAQLMAELEACKQKAVTDQEQVRPLCKQTGCACGVLSCQVIVLNKCVPHTTCYPCATCIVCLACSMELQIHACDLGSHGPMVFGALCVKFVWKPKLCVNFIPLLVPSVPSVLYTDPEGA